MSSEFIVQICFVYVMEVDCFSHLKGCLSNLIRQESITIPQLVQIWINTDHMERAIGYLEKYIAKTTK